MHDTAWLMDEEALDSLVYELSEMRLKNLEEATEKTKALLEISRANSSPRTTAVLIGVLASCYRWGSHLFEAYKLAKESAVMLEEMDMPKYQVLTLNVLGLCHKDMGNPASAFEALLHALTLADDNGFHREYTLTSLNLAYLYANQGKREEAVDQYLRVLNGYSQYCKPFEIPVILNNLASNSIELGRWDDALKYANQALEKVDEQQDKYLYARILTNKAMVLAFEGQVEEALALTEHVQRLCHESDRLSALPSMWFGLGEVFLNAERYEEARTFLEKAKSISKQVEGRPYLQQTLEKLALTYGALGDYKGAYGALNRATELAVAKSWEQTDATVKTALLRQQVEMWEKEVGHLRQINLELVAANEQAEASRKLQSDFLANMGREVRGPIKYAVQMADELLNSNLSEEQRERVQGIRSSCATLLTVVSDILENARA